MNKFERKQYILFLAQQRDKIKVSDLIELLQVERTTIHRDIKELVSESKIQEIKRGVYEYKKDIQEYFEIPFFDRVKKEYNPDFLRSYLPNQTFFLSKEQRLLLKKSIEDIGLNTIFYENNQKLLEKILIDISYSSSYLE
ncbi:MAG: DeoR family transcriptional regulator [Patescibacteria group bacterium]|nr:DeoR family transcriptional regulator [Patescibacteria group bacterium]